MIRLLLLTSVAVFGSVHTAAAYVDQYNETSNNSPLPMLLAIGVCFMVVVGFVAAIFGQSPSREKTADEYNAEALLMAAKRHHLDMRTELRRAEFEAERMEALHKERHEIIAHDKKLRELNAKLETKRSV
jgi:hypothetical protein